jgi:hypothetical protein
MKMIVHETERMNLPIGLLARFFKCFEEKQPIGMVVEDAFLSVSSVYDVIDRPRIFDPNFSPHARTLSMRNIESQCDSLK